MAKKKRTKKVTVPSLETSLNKFLKQDNGSINYQALTEIQKALKKSGFVLLHKETLIKKLASLRLVPGNVARSTVEDML